MKATLVYLSYTTALRDTFLAGGSRTSNTVGPEVLAADCPPLFALDPPPLFALESRPIACRVSPPLFALDPPPLLALEPPPLIALEYRLIVSEVSVVVWIASGDSSRFSSTKSSCAIATSCAIQASESYGESYIVTSVGGGLPLPECLDGPLPTLVSIKAAKVRVIEARVDDRLSTRAIVSLDPSTAGGAAGPPNPVVTPIEVLSAGGGSRSTAPEAVRIGSSAADRIEAPAGGL